MSKLWTIAQVNTVLAMREKGITQRHIATAVGRTLPAVKKILAVHAPRQPRGRPVKSPSHGYFDDEPIGTCRETEDFIANAIEGNRRYVEALRRLGA